MTPHISQEPNEPVALSTLREKVGNETPPNEPSRKFLPRGKKSAGGMFGTSEIIAVSAGALFLIGVLGFYFLWVIPAKAKNKELAGQRDKIEAELKEAKTRMGEGKTTATTVDDLVTSVERFEISNLAPQVTGSTKLYERLNDLIRANGLRNSTGPDYLPLETSDKEISGGEQSKAGRAKFQSLFPGLYITTTVEGSYANLRRFMQQIEQSEQFVIINAVELEPAEAVEEREKAKQKAAPRPIAPTINPNNPNFPPNSNPNFNQVDPNGFNQVNGRNPNFPNPNVPPSQVAPKTAEVEAERTIKRRKGEIVSLKIEMTTYFRRTGVYSNIAQENK